MEAKNESKYERLRRIGVGSYGVVFKCVDRQTGQIVAIKRYSENDSDPTIRKIAMREVRMLRQFKHPNIINLIEVFRRKHRLHLVFDYCELTVLDVIEKYGADCPHNLITKIIWQTVNGIEYCHRHNCIHRDIKPENILVNASGVVKLCDFGFARSLPKSQPYAATTTSQQQPLRLRISGDAKPTVININKENPLFAHNERQALTSYVATRWYRAPELLIGDVYYDQKIDVWAIGCVTAELMRGEPIWPGKNDLDQLSLIKSSLGQLTMSQTHTLLEQAIYGQANIDRLLGQSQNPNEAIERKIPLQIGPSGIDFVSCCLKMNPSRRASSGELLAHSYIKSARMARFVQTATVSPSPARHLTGNGYPPLNQNELVGSSTSKVDLRASRMMSSSLEPSQSPATLRFSSDAKTPMAPSKLINSQNQRALPPLILNSKNGSNSINMNNQTIKPGRFISHESDKPARQQVIKSRRVVVKSPTNSSLGSSETVIGVNLAGKRNFDASTLTTESDNHSSLIEVSAGQHQLDKTWRRIQTDQQGFSWASRSNHADQLRSIHMITKKNHTKSTKPSDDKLYSLETLVGSNKQKQNKDHVKISIVRPGLSTASSSSNVSESFKPSQKMQDSFSSPGN